MQVVIVHQGWGNTTETQARNWLQSFGVTFPALHEGPPYPIEGLYNGEGIPHTYIIGRDMVIRQDVLGAVSCQTLEQMVNALLPVPYAPIFHLTFRLPEWAIPRWIIVAYLLLNEKSKRLFEKTDFRVGGRFNEVIAKHLTAYIKEGVMPPAEIASAIMNMADDFMAGRDINLRAGDYIAIQNHIKLGQRPRPK